MSLTFTAINYRNKDEMLSPSEFGMEVFVWPEKVNLLLLMHTNTIYRVPTAGFFRT